ncbi:hypothetical protein [Adhaeribacter rhizoryzae]|uniref:Uncharacterized protein n=1 Tax=Adhaeribacter rhizoryzae TaxID=2607907 RepID=A0A5M6DBY2_9BACT|nr:hypothetical protein [Adhaeribacter rhizoryzae]KAA5545058.1 hypothetical protein F0145_13475 [Adhaeribacter rhizoryzae]
MPSDNLEKYIKENVEAVQHTLPPGVNWDPEAAWLKLQQPPVLTRRKKTTWFSYAAAIVILALLAGLARQYFVSEQPRTKTLVATKPAKKILTPAKPTENTVAKPVKSQVGNIVSAVKSGEQQLKMALGKKMEQAVKSSALPAANTKINNATVVVMPGTPEVQPAKATEKSEIIAASEAKTPAQTTAQPLKITVVLGKTSTAKMLSQTANNNLPAKRRKTRLRLNVPVPESVDNGHFATTDSAYQLLKLQARIDL